MAVYDLKESGGTREDFLGAAEALEDGKYRSRKLENVVEMITRFCGGHLTGREREAINRALLEEKDRMRWNATDIQKMFRAIANGATPPSGVRIHLAFFCKRVATSLH